MVSLGATTDKDLTHVDGRTNYEPKRNSSGVNWKVDNKEDNLSCSHRSSSHKITCSVEELCPRTFCGAMHTVLRKVAGVVGERFLRLVKKYNSNVITRMTLKGTDSNIWYMVFPLPHTAHAVHRVSQPKSCLGVCVHQGQ